MVRPQPTSGGETAPDLTQACVYTHTHTHTACRNAQSRSAGQPLSNSYTEQPRPKICARRITIRESGARGVGRKAGAPSQDGWKTWSQRAAHSNFRPRWVFLLATIPGWREAPGQHGPGSQLSVAWAWKQPLRMGSYLLWQGCVLGSLGWPGVGGEGQQKSVCCSVRVLKNHPAAGSQSEGRQSW